MSDLPNGATGLPDGVIDGAADPLAIRHPVEVMPRESHDPGQWAVAARQAADEAGAANTAARNAAIAAVGIEREIRDTYREQQELLKLIKDDVSEATQAASDFGELVQRFKQAAAQVEEAKTQALPGSESIKSVLDQLKEQASKIEGLHTRANDTVSTIAERSKHIEEAKDHADKVRVAIDTAHNQVAQHASDGQASLGRLVQYEAQAKESLSAADGSKRAAAQRTSEIDQIRTAAEALRGDLQLSLEKSAAHEAALQLKTVELEALQRLADETLQKIESLLPGATSAGLAAAFKTRRQAFRRPHIFWTQIFLGALGVIFLIALTTVAEPFATWVRSFWIQASSTTAEHAFTWADAGLAALRRLPIAIPFIWLAIYASRQAAQAKRLEEDYGFKEVMARSFEGFRKQMAEVQTAGGTTGPLSTLCQSTLTQITNPPGRIYDGQRSDVSPLTAAADALQPAVEALSKLKVKLPGS